MTPKTTEQLDRIFKARSLALVGASSDPGKLGYMTLNSIVSGGYEGPIYPVNPKGGEIMGLKVYGALSEISEPVDLAVIIVPAKFVPGVMREAAEQKIKGAVILSAGFREAGRADLEEEIAAIARENDLRFVGPNVQGINYLPNKLCAMFFPVITQRGPMAVLTQSGSATAALSEWAAAEGVGISAAVNLGNQTDLCESDYLDYFAQDEHTKVIAMYLEGIADGPRFLASLEKACTQKPVVILKSGRTEAGERSVRSHTGALAGNHRVFNSACRQAGAIITDSIENLYDCAKGVAGIKPPRGNRVLSIATSGGMGTLAADQAQAENLDITPLPEAFARELKQQGLAPLTDAANPLDLGYVRAADFQQAALMADEMGVADIILLNLGDPVPGAVEVAQYLSRKMKASLAVSYLGGGEEEKKGRVEMHKLGLAVYPSPERAMRAIGAALRWAEKERAQSTSDFGRRKPAPPSKRSGPIESRFLLEPEAVELLTGYGVSYPPHGVAHSPEEAAEIAESLGFPVVLKVVSPDVLHKTEAGGVMTGLSSPQAVKKAYEDIMQSASSYASEAKIEGILVCRQAPAGLEAIVGAVQDSVFGPTLMFGLGGIHTEIFKDVSFRVLPIQPRDAEEMIREIKAFPLLAGVRGNAGIDVGSLREMIMAVSRVLEDRPEVREMDLNPVRLYTQGVEVLDVRLAVDKE
ncbi:MAG: acetate--CoA ligase family protein [Desulfarculaceae bacterium]|jgi:acetyltransferase